MELKAYECSECGCMVSDTPRGRRVHRRWHAEVVTAPPGMQRTRAARPPRFVGVDDEVDLGAVQG